MNVGFGMDAHPWVEAAYLVTMFCPILMTKVINVKYSAGNHSKHRVYMDWDGSHSWVKARYIVAIYWDGCSYVSRGGVLQKSPYPITMFPHMSIASWST